MSRDIGFPLTSRNTR